MKKEKNPILYKFGQCLAAVRKRHGATQEDICEKAGFMINTVSNLERGQSDSQITTLYRYSQAGKFSLAEVFSEFENMPLIKSKKLYEIVELLHNQDEKTLELIQKQIELLLPVLKK